MESNKIDYGVLIAILAAAGAFFKDNIIALLNWAGGRKKEKAEGSKAQAEAAKINSETDISAAKYWEEQANKERLAKDEEKRKNAEHIKKIDELETKLRELLQEVTLLRIKVNTSR